VALALRVVPVGEVFFRGEVRLPEFPVFFPHLGSVMGSALRFAAFLLGFWRVATIQRDFVGTSTQLSVDPDVFATDLDGVTLHSNGRIRG